jgi:hypothetical protein
VVPWKLWWIIVRPISSTEPETSTQIGSLGTDVIKGIDKI